MGKYRVTTTNEVPAGPHYAIFESNSIYIPGDERSRQYPGHGYPASTEYFISYIAFDTKAEWEADIQERVARNNTDKFVAVHITPAVIETKVVVSVTPATGHSYTTMCPKCGEIADTVARDGFSTRRCANGHQWLPKDDKQPA